MLLFAVIFTLFNKYIKSDLRQIAGSAITNGVDTEVKYDPQYGYIYSSDVCKATIKNEKPVTKIWAVGVKNCNLRVILC